MNEKETKTRLIEHPLEDTLDIEPGTTMVEYEESLPAELVNQPTYDKKDDEIENQLENIRTVALDAYSDQQDVTETVEGKYAARSAEVAAQFLNTALEAIKEKAALKKHKDKIAVAAAPKGPHTLNQNVIVADRNDILKALQNKKDIKTIIEQK